jgi:MerR family copper efflux transcriptional regulator
MRISELAERAGVSSSRIRFYEKVGLLPPAGRRGNGYRDYGAEDLQLVGIVERAQRLGFSLREIGGFLPHPSNGPLSCDEMLRLLAIKLVETDRLALEVRRRRRDIVALMDDIHAGVYHPGVDVTAMNRASAG